MPSRIKAWLVPNMHPADNPGYVGQAVVPGACEEKAGTGSRARWPQRMST